MTDHTSKGAATQLCSAPASQDPDQCPGEKCTWVDDYDVCVPNRMAAEKHWGGEHPSRLAQSYMQRVDDMIEQRETQGEAQDEEDEDSDWWRRKSYTANTANPGYSDGLPAEWLRLVQSDGAWLATFQAYLKAAFTGQERDSNGNPTGIKAGTHDWRARLQAMGESGEAAACRGVKGLAPYQAVSERLAMTAKLDGARGFLAYHSVGSGKTITSAACIDAFLGGEDRDDWDLFFITTSDNLAQSAEMMEEIPLISWRERWTALREETAANTRKDRQRRSSEVLRALKLKFSDSGKTDKKTRASYFAQKYDDFATSINAASVRQRMRRAGRSLQSYGGESGNSYFINGNDRRPIIRRGKSLVDEDGNYRPLRNCVIMMDEIQNILTPTGRDQTELYNSLREEIMREPEVKVLLLTATPGDTPAQMCDILNLLVRPPRYLREGTGVFPSMCSGGGYVARHPTHFLRVEDYLNPVTGKLIEGFETRLQNAMSQRSLLVSFVHANEDRSVFAEEICTGRDPATGRCAGEVVTYMGGNDIAVPDTPTSHVHVHAPMTFAQQQGVLFTETRGHSKRANVGRELKGDHYTYTGYRINPVTGATAWSATLADGCKATNADGTSVTMPVCDANDVGLSEHEFLKVTRKLSTIRWTQAEGKRMYVAPKGLHTIDDVRNKVSSKIAAMLAVIRRFPDHKHVVICSKFEGDTDKAYKQELGYALHTLLGALDESVMGFKWHPTTHAVEKGDKVSWSVRSEKDCRGHVGGGGKCFGLYLTQMPRDKQSDVKSLFNAKSNVGTHQPFMNVMITNRIEGLSLKTTTFVHLLDAPVSTKNYYQAIGRAVRFCSHAGMEDRRVRVYEYFATLPTSIPVEYKKCTGVEKVIDDAIATLRDAWTNGKLTGQTNLTGQEGIVFHVDRPTVDNVPIDSIDLVSGAISPPPPDGKRTFAGFAGDLEHFNGRGRVVRGRIVGGLRHWGAQLEDRERAADAVFGTPLRRFLADAQISRVVDALIRIRADASALQQVSMVSCSATHKERDALARAEAIYRRDHAKTKNYDKAARTLGIAARKEGCSSNLNALPQTSHDQRVREQLLLTKEEGEDVRVSTVQTALQQMSNDATPLSEQEEEVTQKRLRAEQDNIDNANALLHKAHSVIDAKKNRARVNLEDALLRRGSGDIGAGGRRARKKTTRECGVYDPSRATGQSSCATKADCAAGYKCNKTLKLCQPSRKGGELTFSTDTMLTKFSGIRFGVTRQFTMAIMGAAVDCLLLFDFHTQHDGAMYNLKKCMAH